MPAKNLGPQKDPIAVAFGARVNELRRERGLTQKELARIAGYDAISMSRLVNGEIMPKIDTAVSIARALSVSTGELFSGQDTENSTTRPDRARERDAKRLSLLEALAEDFDLLLQVLEERASAPSGQPTWSEAIESKRKIAHGRQS